MRFLLPLRRPVPRRFPRLRRRFGQCSGFLRNRCPRFREGKRPVKRGIAHKPARQQLLNGFPRFDVPVILACVPGALLCDWVKRGLGGIGRNFVLRKPRARLLVVVLILPVEIGRFPAVALPDVLVVLLPVRPERVHRRADPAEDTARERAASRRVCQLG